MNLPQLFFIYVLFISLFVVILATPNNTVQRGNNINSDTNYGATDEGDLLDVENEFFGNSSTEIDQYAGEGRFLLQKKLRAARLTCNKFPRVCHAKGSPGHRCCKKKCVNVLTDRLNCGHCGKKCKFNEICCNGYCVNPFFSNNHCGGCNKRCGTKSVCFSGLCNYA